MPIAALTDKIEMEVRAERAKQDTKFLEQNHDPFKWLAILGEEVGEANNAVLESFNWKEKTFNQAEKSRPEVLAHLREELIQIAAVTKAFIQCIDRNTWK